MAATLARRIFLAHLELNYRLGRRVTLAEFGEMIARQMGREMPFTAAAVSRWEAGAQAPTFEVIEAIATLTQTDPGWLSHGDKSAAPGPPRAAGTVGLPESPGSLPPRAPRHEAPAATPPQPARPPVRIRPKPE